MSLSENAGRMAHDAHHVHGHEFVVELFFEEVEEILDLAHHLGAFARAGLAFAHGEFVQPGLHEGDVGIFAAAEDVFDIA